MGYTNVFVYNEGLPEWIKRGYPAELKKAYPKIEVPVISAADLKRMLDRKEKVFLLDLRDADDLKAGKIAGSRTIDLEELDTRYTALPRDRKIVLIDLHGKQTNLAGRFLASKGISDLARLDGGIVSGWIKAGYPLVP